jgi:cyclase
MLPRVIPVLGINKNRLVKTVQFKKPNYLGDPLNAIRIFNQKMVDEIAIVDIRASLNNSALDFDLIENMAEECFSPLAYGGGIKTYDDASKLFSIGVEKIILNSAAFSTPKLIEEVSKKYGSQSIVVSVDIKKSFLGGYKLRTHSGTQKVKGSIEHWLKVFIDLGVGEILLHDIDREGTFSGYNSDLIQLFSKEINVPMIALGGARNFEDMREALKNGAQAVSAASFFVYRNNNPESILIDYPKYEQVKKELALP